MDDEQPPARPGVRGGVQPGTTRPAKGRYELRPHSVAGLVSVLWLDAEQPRGTVVINLATDRVRLLGHAITVFTAGAAGEYERGRADAQAEAAELAAWERGRASMLDELATMDATDRAALLSRARHPSTTAPAPLRAVPGPGAAP